MQANCLKEKLALSGVHCCFLFVLFFGNSEVLKNDDKKRDMSGASFKGKKLGFLYNDGARFLPFISTILALLNSVSSIMLELWGKTFFHKEI